MKMDTHLVPLIPGVTGVLGKIYPLKTLEKVFLGKIYPLKTLEKVSYLPLKYTLKTFQCRCMNPDRRDNGGTFNTLVLFKLRQIFVRKLFTLIS
jgi:hypothetical protein